MAQDGTGLAPSNAEDRRFGSGWDCDPGYRIENGDCAALSVPENAHPTGRSHGTGWACRRGYPALAKEQPESRTKSPPPLQLLIAFDWH